MSNRTGQGVGWRGGGTDADMRYSAVISACLHIIILAALLISVPWTRPPEPPQETAFTVDFVGPNQAAKSLRTGHNAAQDENKTQQPKPPAPKPPKLAPIEAPPPPPPPPPPAQAVQAPSVPDSTVPPPPDLSPLPTLAPLPKPAPPQPKPKPPAQASRTNQPNPTKQALADSQTIENTLEKLRVLQKQKAPPKHRYNPDAGGAQDAGGALNGNDTSKLTKSEMGAIGDHVRQCWSYDAGAKDANTFQVRLAVTTDATGTARIAKVVGPDIDREAADPEFRAFAERAVRAVLSPDCANLPLPKSMLGQSQTLQFNFRP